MAKHAGDEVWTARLENFLNDCMNSREEEQNARIADAANLFLSIPLVQSQSADAAKTGSVRALIAAGAALDAALAIIGTDAVFMLSRGGDGTCLATMILSDGTEEVMGEAGTPALALLAAYTAAVLTRVGNSVAGPLAQDGLTGARLH
ncbi:hypothetical protein [Novosphingobium aquimarinum]|uniref:hypothetical protein n=1 Tax=Novosphingobium aquimarinum TaxID=2682494 RepID=UPI0012EC666C|nr:hypothetical protein [Novosphingobium aquimarinum]